MSLQQSGPEGSAVEKDVLVGGRADSRTGAGLGELDSSVEEKATREYSPSDKLADAAISPYFLTSDGQEPKTKGLPAVFDHFNARDLKTLFKASMAVWIYSLFIVISPTIKAIGQATFFGCILLFLVPCSGLVFIQVLGTMTLLVGMGLGWAWGVICMKAALATRPQAETNARLQLLGMQASQLAANSEQASGQSQYQQVLIYDGFMLDSRVTVTYYCLGCFFIYFMGRLRVSMPKLTLTAIFSMAVLDIFLVIAPLLPSFEGLIGQLLVKPAAIAAGVGLVCNILLFPESTSHKTVHDMEQIFKPMKGFLTACHFAFEKPTATFSLTALQGIKTKTLMTFKDLEAGLAFLPLDFAIGRWSAEDIMTTKEPLAKLVTMFVGLVQLKIDRLNTKAKMNMLDDLGTSEDHPMKHTKNGIGAHQIALSLDMRHAFHHPEQEQLLQKSLAALFISSGDILGSCNEALDALIEAMHAVNTTRISGRLTKEACEEMSARHEAVLHNLHRHAEGFATQATEHLIDPHEHLFDESGKLRSHSQSFPPLHGLITGLMYEERILGVARSLEALLQRVIDLERSRTETKFWFPPGIRHFFSWAFSTNDAPALHATGNTSLKPLDESALVTKDRRRRFGKVHTSTRQSSAKEEKPDAVSSQQLGTLRYQHGKQRSKTGKIILSVVNWLKSDASLLGVRAVLVTIIIGIVGVNRTSAGFFYREKGLWALIMAQMALGTYTADFAFGFCVRVGGTVVGATVGLVCWYIADGDNGGNPYGLAVMMAVAVVFLMWFRLFMPPQWMQGTILLGATTFLVIGYSWADSHIPSYGNPGTGYNVYWERIVLVIIGFAVAAIVMLFPRPPSASRHYRSVLALTIRNMKDLYALLIASWEDPHEGLIATVEKETLKTAETLGAIMGPLKTLQFEFSTTNFDSEALSKITKLCMTMNQTLVQMFIFSAKMPKPLRDRFQRVTAALNEDFVGDIMAVLTLVEQSIKTGDPLPAVLPVPLVARSMGLARRIQEMDRGENVITRDMILDEDFRRYTVVIANLVQFLGAADELVMMIKSTCGETHLVDVEAWPLMARGPEVASTTGSAT